MPATGRAAVFLGPGKPFEIREYPVPEPRPGQIVVRVRRTNVCGSDLHMWRGDFDLSEFGIGWPVILGHETVGEVHAVGEGAGADAHGRALRPGDRVVFPYLSPCGRCRACLRGMVESCPLGLAYMLRPADVAPHFFGAFAEYLALPRRQHVFRVPDALPDEVAGAANCALAQVIWGLDRARLAFGETVAVQGAGGLGLYAIAVAREMGAQRIVALDAIPERLELARAFGADEVIDVGAVPDPRARVARVKAALDQWGADVVCELVGRPEVVPEGVRMLAPGGRYLEIGNISPRRTYQADPSLLVMGSRSIVAVGMYPPAALARAIGFLERCRDRYPFARIASETFPLARIGEAFEAADAFGRRPTVARVAVRCHAQAPAP